MHLLQVIIYGIVQGITELFPISSVGHAVILPYLFRWTEFSESNQFLPFVVMLHLGTGLALLIYFLPEWIHLIASIFDRRRRIERRILLLIIVATIPAAVLGKIFEHKLQELFPSALSASIFLIVNGLILFWADGMRRRRRRNTTRIENLSFGRSFFIGIVQSLALIPGFSRSGITMAAGLASGLEYEDAARFSFLLATPVILGAGILEVPKMLHQHNHAMFHDGLIGGLCAGVLALLSTAFLMRYFQTTEVRALRPFGWYCIVVGVVVAILAALHIQF
ncbi:undecaprenyl-diphosphate phosphatase [Alicyclobacillus acidocaldarius]|uniref:Undecaprenyl-diphosphatase n=1 Tax=Alicyclobacillus acidocaldarius subsp. acidocaldarius (strain ATCC 27009 / DSM 446 / BCRC 14685 / JCM 5260 / KCTC 1825 / NBRC 15652 / NCIMB 11725 / NRRL B-14509 / 104-IA) TaxID=521098 RepID=C8WQU7_ALIAD|nr:undecaprenyl-diphosphate phosphatase [Alicyclobacillus acidocaldarius]ACV57275.1 Undecaprenyl-diphosphatase [Alicyclobacillus acidocaldarius subsp. acidocaldarius DSM 446]